MIWIDNSSIQTLSVAANFSEQCLPFLAHCKITFLPCSQNTFLSHKITITFLIIFFHNVFSQHVLCSLCMESYYFIINVKTNGQQLGSYIVTCLMLQFPCCFLEFCLLQNNYLQAASSRKGSYLSSKPNSTHSYFCTLKSGGTEEETHFGEAIVCSFLCHGETFAALSKASSPVTCLVANCIHEKILCAHINTLR